jgi:hypothetical protein
MTAMLTMLGTDLIGVLAFGGLYWAGASRRIPEPAFLPLLVLLFVGFTYFWVRTENRESGGLRPLKRAGRIAGGLAGAILLAPGVVLGPLFAIGRRLPAGNPLEPMTRHAMALLLIALTLTVLVNLAGSGAVVVSALWGRRKLDWREKEE